LDATLVFFFFSFFCVIIFPFHHLGVVAISLDPDGENVIRKQLYNYISRANTDIPIFIFIFMTTKIIITIQVY